MIKVSIEIEDEELEQQNTEFIEWWVREQCHSGKYSSELPKNAIKSVTIYSGWFMKMEKKKNYNIQAPFGYKFGEDGNAVVVPEEDMKDFAKNLYGNQKVSEMIDDAPIQEVIQELRKNGFDIKRM